MTWKEAGLGKFTDSELVFVLEFLLIISICIGTISILFLKLDLKSGWWSDQPTLGSWPSHRYATTDAEAACIRGTALLPLNTFNRKV